MRIAAVFFFIGSLTAAAAMPAAAQADDRADAVVVEVFLSQACKLSPPAAEYLDELKSRPDLVVLSLHVDYWNLLANRKHGRWEDPFARPEFGVRQRIYNRRIRGRGTVFTPQAIVNGAGSAVGSKRRQMEEMIDAASSVRRPARIEFSVDGQNLTAAVRSAGEPREAYLVRFKTEAATKVAGGDNAGIVFREPNVVTELIRLGTITPRRATFSFPTPAAGTGCAVLLQERGQGAITAAKYCPAAP